MTETLAYYDQNAADFFSNTVNVDMTSLHDRFLSTVSPGGMVLDAGCGSGRDAKSFLTRGFRVAAFDASSELARMASEHTGIDIAVRRFSDVREQCCYDGVWACASLLHLPQVDIPAALERLWATLKPGGTFYLSFKLGVGERFQNGRHFTDVSEAQLRSWVTVLPDLGGVECWLTADQRPGRSEQWLNAIVLRAPQKEELFANERCVPLTDAWIDQYEARRVPLPRAVAPGSQEQDPPPQPTPVQSGALLALSKTRDDGFRRGLVVLATGLGKTWLAAFDAEQVGARRILFVAHREEILNQAAETFLRIRPRSRVGFYMGQTRDVEVDVLCASVQTLGRNIHLERFSPQHFDYIVVDEFHHASATTYRRLLNYFAPRFLLGLTATPERSDQSDILSLCDDNLVFTCGLFAGIRSGLLAPFHYYGIFDDSVDYTGIPWRNGRFDPEQLSNKLATLARARHALKTWRQHKQERTLAFCVSIAHAEFMATQFGKAGVACAAVYSGSTLSRADALERLRNGRLAIIFSVDLFNEGVDLPALDTVMMLRPTESKILFLQQLGRGLRKSEGKERLVVIDFIGNHQSFLHKPQALFEVGASYKQLANFARQVEQNRLALPDGCYINYDLRLIDFLKSLDSDGIRKEYEALKACLGRRPSLTEFYRAGASLPSLRKQYGSWFELVGAMGDLETDEEGIAIAHQAFLREVETTAMNKSFKMVLLEAFQELGGWRAATPTTALAERSWQVLQRRRTLLEDLPDVQRQLPDGGNNAWHRYWCENPIKAWSGGNRAASSVSFFKVVDGSFQASFSLSPDHQEMFESMLQELIDCRLAGYEIRRTNSDAPDNVLPFKRIADVASADRTELPFFPNLKL